MPRILGWPAPERCAAAETAAALVEPKPVAKLPFLEFLFPNSVCLANIALSHHNNPSSERRQFRVPKLRMHTPGDSLHANIADARSLSPAPSMASDAVTWCFHSLPRPANMMSGTVTWCFSLSTSPLQHDVRYCHLARAHVRRYGLLNRTLEYPRILEHLQVIGVPKTANFLAKWSATDRYVELTFPVWP